LQVQPHPRDDQAGNHQVDIEDSEEGPIHAAEQPGHQQQVDEMDGYESQVLEPTLTGPVTPAFGRSSGVGCHTAHQVEGDHPGYDQLYRRLAQTSKDGIQRRAKPGQQ